MGQVDVNMAASGQAGTTNGVQPTSAPRPPKHPITCQVTMPDGNVDNFVVDRSAYGKELLDQVTNKLDLKESDYFALNYVDSLNYKNWLYPDKRIKKQIADPPPYKLNFAVKFYPPDPSAQSAITEDLTRYLLYLQVRDDVNSGRLPCSFAAQALLGSYVAQAELGDYSPRDHGHTDSSYLTAAQCVPGHVTSQAMLDKVHELHKLHKGQMPADAEFHYLDNASKLSLYGVDLHKAKDANSVNIQLGVCAHGVLLFRDQVRVNRYPWPKVLEIAYRRNDFSIRLKPGEQTDKSESNVRFKMPNYRASKRLYKSCVEHHTFFRLMKPEVQPKRNGLLRRFGSQRGGFRYSGRTQFQSKLCNQAAHDRPPPVVQRSQSARLANRSLDETPIQREHQSFEQNPAATPLHYADDGTTTQQKSTSPSAKSPDLDELSPQKKADSFQTNKQHPFTAGVTLAGAGKKKHRSKSSSSASSSDTTSSSESGKGAAAGGGAARRKKKKKTKRDSEEVLVVTKTTTSMTSWLPAVADTEIGVLRLHASPDDDRIPLTHPVLNQPQHYAAGSHDTTPVDGAPAVVLSAKELKKRQKEEEQLKKQNAKKEKERRKQEEKERKRREKEAKKKGAVTGKSTEPAAGATLVKVGGLGHKRSSSTSSSSSSSSARSVDSKGNRRPKKTTHKRKHKDKQTVGVAVLKGDDSPIEAHHHHDVSQQQAVAVNGPPGVATGVLTHTEGVEDPNDDGTTIVRQWEESADGPVQVTTETDEHGNIITRTSQVHTVKQTIQKQTVRTYEVDDDHQAALHHHSHHHEHQPPRTLPLEAAGSTFVQTKRQVYSPVGGEAITVPPHNEGDAAAKNNVIQTQTRSIVYESGDAAHGGQSTKSSTEIPAEFVSSKTVTSGNRTVEEITYKTELPDGTIEMHVEHRVTVHGGAEIDHDAELDQAIMEATLMNPDMTVEKIEVKQETQC